MRNLVKIYRWEAGLKQYELAARLGCSPPYLSLVENFRVEPSSQFKESVSDILRVPKEVLFPKETSIRSRNGRTRGFNDRALGHSICPICEALDLAHQVA